MHILILIAVLSLLLLFFSFLLVYSKVVRKTMTKFFIFLVSFFLMAYPVLSTVYGELARPWYSKSTELGVAFLFTWVMTAIIFVFSIVFRYKQQEEDEFYLL
ncbi:hypothetical protein [Bacillus sp. T3]|uniref:hypothetical protein n=1 Tax=Bacillus sp. T3 TaxID=467262 RepID=UPI002982AE7D|nr:hypothetical protein [Bacillus sp. T3]